MVLGPIMPVCRELTGRVLTVILIVTMRAGHQTETGQGPWHTGPHGKPELRVHVRISHAESLDFLSLEIFMLSTRDVHTCLSARFALGIWTLFLVPMNPVQTDLSSL